MEVQAIKKYMKEKKITYDELAARSGLSISTIKKIFSGISQYPRIDTMAAIESALELNQSPVQSKKFNEQTIEPNLEPKLLNRLQSLNSQEIQELSLFVDYLLSKRKKNP